jgi:hypothetical protein
MSPEFALLCEAARPEPDPRALDTRLGAALDWPLVLQQSLRHQIPVQLHQALRTREAGEVPEFVHRRLLQLAQFIAIRNQRLVQELLRLLGELEAQGIAAIPFKGSVLAWLAYGDLGRRPFADLDIFVPRDQMLAAHELLLAEGYVNQRPQRDFGRRSPRLLRSSYHYDEWYWKTLDERDLFGARVELHWATSPDHAIHPMEPEGLWARRIVLPLAGGQVFSFAPQDLFLLLCVNYSKDHWRYLRMVADIVALWQRQGGLDWALMLEQARVLGRRRALLLAFALARECLGAIPPALIAGEMARDPVLPPLAQSVMRRLIRGGGDEPGPGNKLLYNFRLRQGLATPWRYTLASLRKLLGGL